jgi:hypothetical protein
MKWTDQAVAKCVPAAGMHVCRIEGSQAADEIGEPGCITSDHSDHGSLPEVHAPLQGKTVRPYDAHEAIAML